MPSSPPPERGTIPLRSRWAPAARSRGLARLLLDALEDAARALGYRVARLDTASWQRHAVAL